MASFDAYQESLSVHLPSSLTSPEFLKEQRIYKQVIYPYLKKIINKEYLDNKEQYLLATALASNLDQHVKKIIEKFKKTLSADKLNQAQDLLTPERLKSLLIYELENIAAIEFHFSSTQIDLLRVERNKMEFINKQTGELEKINKKYQKERDEIIQSMKSTISSHTHLINEKKINKDTAIKMESLNLPITVMRDTWMKKLDAKRSKLGETLTQAHSRLAQVNRNLFKIPQAPALIKQKKEESDLITRAEEELEKVNAAIDQYITQFDIIYKKGMKEEWKALLKNMPISKEVSRSIDDISNLSEVEIEAFEITRQKLMAQLATNHQYTPQELDDMQAQLSSINELFQKLEVLDKTDQEIKILKNEIKSVKKQNQQKLQDLTANFNQQFIDYISQGLTPQSLINLEKDLPNETYSLLWLRLFENIFSSNKLNNLSPNVKLTRDLQARLTDYVEAKRICFQKDAMNSVHKNARKKINDLESQLPDHIQKYVKAEVDMSHREIINDLILSPAVIEDARRLKNDSYPLFTPDQQADLMALTRILDKISREPPGILTTEDPETIKKVITKAKQDPKFQKHLKLLLSGGKGSEQFLEYLPVFTHQFVKKHIFGDVINVDVDSLSYPKGITEDGLTLLSITVSKLNKIDKYPAVLEKAKKLLALHSAGDLSKIQDEHKLTLREIGLISDLNRAKETAEQLEKMNMLDVDPQIKALVGQIKEAVEIYTKLEEAVLPTLPAHYKNGSFLAYSGPKKLEWTGKKPDLEENLTGIISDFGLTHGAKLYTDKTGNVSLSHVYNKWRRDKVDLYKLLISDVWELDVSALVDPTLQNTFKRIYGDDWQNKMNQEYQNIEKDLHDNIENHFNRINNSSERRLQAGFANYAPILNLVAPQEIKSHTRSFIRDFNQVHKKFFEHSDTSETQICSEFASKASIAAMVELNKSLTNKLLKIHHSLSLPAVLKKLDSKKVVLPTDVREYLTGVRFYKDQAVKTEQAEKKLIKILKENDYSAQDIDLIIRLGNKEVFTLPYSKKERLRAIHPGRMVKLLLDAKCVKKKELPPLAETLFKAEIPVVRL
jgi:hypothetical protein